MIIMGNLFCNNCICDSAIKLYYKMTDCMGCYKTNRVYMSHVPNGRVICEYPYCFSMPQYNSAYTSSDNSSYFEYRGRLYCSSHCLNSHKKMGYTGHMIEQTNYADL